MKVTKNLAPALHRPESKVVLSSDVTLCWAELSTQSHSTVCPLVTVTVGGANVPTVFGSGLILTTWDAVPLVLPPLGVQAEPPPPSPLELPHAASTRALPAATIAIFQTVTCASLSERFSPGLSLRGGAAPSPWNRPWRRRIR